MSAHETVSEKWLKNAQSAVNADPSFRKRGSIDVKMAVKSDKSTYLITFGGFSCHDVRTITDAALRDADFTIDMSADQWGRFVQGRRNGSGRTLVGSRHHRRHHQGDQPAQEARFPALPHLSSGVLRRRRARRLTASRLTDSSCRSTPTVAAIAAT